MCVRVRVLLSIGVLVQLISLVFSTRLWHRTCRVLVFIVIHPCGVPYVLRGPVLHPNVHSFSCPLVLARHCLHEARVKCNSTVIVLASVCYVCACGLSFVLSVLSGLYMLSTLAVLSVCMFSLL